MGQRIFYILLTINVKHITNFALNVVTLILTSNKNKQMVGKKKNLVEVMTFAKFKNY